MSFFKNPTLARLRALQPYFKGTGWAVALTLVGAAVGASTESTMALLMRPLMDQGFQHRGLSLWQIPLAIIGLFFVRGIA
ncbi:MAG TPA: lipid ABC transporter permease/ATP-binding protein, partial [Methylibium sp.]